jgi:hypothetical protein
MAAPDSPTPHWSGTGKLRGGRLAFGFSSRRCACWACGSLMSCSCRPPFIFPSSRPTCRPRWIFTAAFLARNRGGNAAGSSSNIFFPLVALSLTARPSLRATESIFRFRSTAKIICATPCCRRPGRVAADGACGQLGSRRRIALTPGCAGQRHRLRQRIRRSPLTAQRSVQGQISSAALDRLAHRRDSAGGRPAARRSGGDAGGPRLWQSLGRCSVSRRHGFLSHRRLCDGGHCRRAAGACVQPERTARDITTFLPFRRSARKCRRIINATPICATAPRVSAADLETILKRDPLQWYNFFPFWRQPAIESPPQTSPKLCPTP